MAEGAEQDEVTLPYSRSLPQNEGYEQTKIARSISGVESIDK